MMGLWSDKNPGSSTPRKPCGLPTQRSTASFWHKEPSALLMGHRSTRDLPEYADVVVIGSGMTGTSIAHHLLTDRDVAQKLNVVLLEAREACWGATGRNGGHCQPTLFEHPDDPSIGHFELKNFHALRHLIEEKQIDCEFVVQPGVRAIYSRGHLDDIELAILKLRHLAPEQAKMMRLVTGKDELNALRIPTAIGALVTDLAARMWPYKLVSRILEELLTSTKLNGTFNLQTLTPVTQILRDASSDAVLVRTYRGSIRSKKVVLATNAYTSHLLHSFTDLIVPCRGQMSALIPFPSVAGEKRLKTSFGFLGDGLDDYLIQRPNETGGHLMFGGGRQEAPSMDIFDDNVVDEKTAHYLRGRLVETLHLRERGHRTASDIVCGFCKGRNVVCERTADGKPCRNCDAFGLLCDSMTHTTTPADAASGEEMNATHMWTGIMGFSRDEKPWVGSVPSQESVFVAAGFTGHGMPNCWLSGKAVASMVAKSIAGSTMMEAVEAATQEIELPKSYVISVERMTAALELTDVAAKDWAEMDRGKSAAKPASGYA